MGKYHGENCTYKSLTTGDTFEGAFNLGKIVKDGCMWEQKDSDGQLEKKQQIQNENESNQQQQAA